MIVTSTNQYGNCSVILQEQERPKIGDYVPGENDTRGGICVGFHTEVVPESTEEDGTVIPEHSYEIINLVTSGIVYVTQEQAAKAVHSGYWYYDLSLKHRKYDGNIIVVAITSEPQNLNVEMVSLPKEQYDKLIETLKFYANNRNYHEIPLEEARAMLGGKDPTISIKSATVNHEAKSGYALSAMQHDNNGEKAREALKLVGETL